MKIKKAKTIKIKNKKTGKKTTVKSPRKVYRPKGIKSYRTA